MVSDKIERPQDHFNLQISLISHVHTCSWDDNLGSSILRNTFTCVFNKHGNPKKREAQVTTIFIGFYCSLFFGGCYIQNTQCGPTPSSAPEKTPGGPASCWRSGGFLRPPEGPKPLDGTTLETLSMNFIWGNQCIYQKIYTYISDYHNEDQTGKSIDVYQKYITCLHIHFDNTINGETKLTQLDMFEKTLAVLVASTPDLGKRGFCENHPLNK